MGGDVIGKRPALSNAPDAVLGVASAASCVKRRTTVRLDGALESQPVGFALDTLLAAKKVVLHLRVEFTLEARGSFGWCADNLRACSPMS